MPTLPTSPPCRFVGLDVHKHSIMVAAVDKEQETLLRPRRVALPEFLNWAQTHLQPTDAVVLEASVNAGPLYDQLAPLVASVTVAHPLLVKAISAAKVKTDARDSTTLARLLAAGLIPAVWVPPPHVRDLRMLLAHRQRLIRQRTQTQNRLHSILQAHQVLPPAGHSPFAASQRAWWESLPLSALEQLRVRQDVLLLDQFDPLVAELDAQLVHLSMTEPWAAQTPFLIQLPGIGVIIALTLLAAIGDITRFPSAKKLVGYSGLGAGVHASGQTYQTGRITKQGRRELRTTMIEAAWVAVEHHPHWKTQFERLTGSIGKRKAIVAIARKLLVAVWHVLTEQVADCHADPVRVAGTFLRWTRQKRLASSPHLAHRAFVRQMLDQVGLGAEVEQFRYGSQVYVLPPTSVVKGTG
jgi:transposase